MSDFLHLGWHEFLLPATTRAGGTEYLRVWIDMSDVVPMLRRLDLIYGDPDHPYTLDLRQGPEAQRTLLRLVAEHLLEQPGALRRAAATRRFAAEMQDRFGVAPANFPLPYPSFIDQVDLDPAQTAVALPMVLDRDALGLATKEGSP
ncbi:hypothetical protein [Streptomyces sp. NPDC059909]|uniref:hypothetical protein n=1 Tax=Streptomyces sp. NPDC059909 TaxID=3346998 RepID=UPI00366A1005